MTEDNHTPADLFAEHAELTRRIERLSDVLDRLERRAIAGHPIDEGAYAKIENEWWLLTQQRQAVDDAILRMAITDDWQVAYKGAVVHRVLDFAPERHDELWGQHAYQVEAWACRSMAA
jgi:hypothetical protein